MKIQPVILPEHKDLSFNPKEVFSAEELNYMNAYVHIARPDEYYFVNPELALEQRKAEYLKLKKSKNLHDAEKLVYINKLLELNNCTVAYGIKPTNMKKPKNKIIFPSSKGYRRFNTRMLKFREDLELADIVVKGKELLAAEKMIFANVDKAQHPAMAKRKSTANSRDLVVRHLQNTCFESFMKDLYEETTEYIHYIMTQAIESGADINKMKDRDSIAVSIDSILSLSSYEEIVKELKETILNSITQRSTLYLLSNINAKLALTIDNNLVNEALPYLECRHYLVHSDGVFSKEFLKKYPHFHHRIGNKIQVDASLIGSAFEKVNNLLQAIDKEVITKRLVQSSEQE